MFRKLLSKIIETISSVLPISLLIILLDLTPLIDLSMKEILIFGVMSILLVLGIAMFNLGAEVSMSQMGEKIGTTLIKTNKLWLILGSIFILGLLITIAEPDLKVLGSQVNDAINSNILIISVGAGVGLFLSFAILKIIFKLDLTQMLLFFYMVAFAMTALVLYKNNASFLSLAFDSGGVTTGPITVPFIMALGLGIAQTVGGRDANENSFGLISLCSIGPIIVILVLAVIYGKGEIDFSTSYDFAGNVVKEFFVTFAHTMGTVSIALILVIAFFMVFDLIYLHLPAKKLMIIGLGALYTYFGLVIFLTAAEIGFMPVGHKLGVELANHKAWMIIFAFVIGMFVVLAEPAIHVLTRQVEEVTNGGVTRRQMLIALSLGVGVAISTAVIRIMFDFSILYIVIPGYLISLGLSFCVPKLYTSIAFDSGGVASGPLTSTFILPFAVGACEVMQDSSKILSDAFGVVALVAMIPLITIQSLGFKAVVQKKVKEKRFIKRIVSADDEQIIRFM